jgi:glycosyltransferase involved in cell wall biosynthesis
MKVVIAAVTAPSEMNGVSRHAANLASALLESQAISDIHFIGGAWQRGLFQRSFERDDSRYHEHWIQLRDARVGRLGWYNWELPHIARQLGADVVHFVCPAPARSGAFRCSTVVSLHDLYPFDLPENFGRLRSSFTRWIMAGCLRNVDAIACVSESTRTRLEKWFPELVSRSATICNVVEPGKPSRLEPLGFIPDGGTFLLCVAQHRKNKNVALAIQILNSLIQQRVLPCSSQMLVIGIPGPETRTIYELVRHLKLDQNVCFLSGITDAELQWCYRHGRLLLAPSSTEGFGLPVVEALLAGCPVVCSDIPAFREIAGAACHYVKCGDDAVPSFVDAVRQVLRMQRPAPLPLPQLSARAVGQQYANLYQSLTCRGVSDFWYATATRT